MTNPYEMVAVFTGKADGIERAVKDSNKSFDKFEKKSQQAGKSATKSFGLVKAAVIGVATVLTGRLITGLVNTITTFEKLQASLKTVLGSADAAAAAFDQIQQFAATTPFQLDEVVSGFIKLKALGLDPSEAALRSYGNTASAMGKSLNQFVEAVADAATGEFERLKEFGIKARTQGEQITFIFQGQSTTVRKTASDIEGYLRGIGNVQFAGAMEEQADTLNVSLSNLEDSFSKLGKAIGDAGFTGAVKALVDWIKSLVESVTDAVKNIEVLAAKLGVIVDSFTGLKNTFGTIGAGIKSIFSNASQAVGGHIDYIKAQVSSIAPLSIQVKQQLAEIEEAAKNEALFKDFWQKKALESATVKTPTKEESGASGKEKGKSPIEKLLGGSPAETLIELQDYFLTAEEQEIAHHQRKINEIQRFLETQKNLTADQRSQLQAIEDQHVKVMADKQSKFQSEQLRDQGNAFVSLLGQAASANKKFFTLHKIAKLAQGVLDAKSSILSAYSFGSKLAGPVGGAAAAAVAAAATAAHLSAIASSSPSGSGGASSGGGGGSFRVPRSDRAQSTPDLPAQQQTVVIKGLRDDEIFSGDRVRQLIRSIGEQLGDNVRFDTA